MVFSLLLAAGLLVLVVGLSWLQPAEYPITAEQFQALKEAGVVQYAGVGERGVHCRLVRPVRLRHQGRVVVVQEVLLEEKTRPAPEEIEQWRKAGILVEFVPEESGRGRREWGGFVVIGILLGIGVWTLGGQIRRYRREGSPRQHLAEVEEEFRQGKLTPEEYSRKVEMLSAQL